jgi:hypothetical protein
VLQEHAEPGWAHARHVRHLAYAARGEAAMKAWDFSDTALTRHRLDLERAGLVVHPILAPAPEA